MNFIILSLFVIQLCYSNVIQIEKNPKWKIIHGVEEIPYPAKSQPNPVNIAIDIANDEDNTSTIDNSNASETIEVLELGQKTTVIARNCQRYDLFLNYTGFKVEWDGKEGNPINQILVTDVELSSFECDISSFSYCHHSAKLCLLRNMSNSNKNDDDEEIKIKVKNCFKNVFIYIYINDTDVSNKSYGKLDIKKERSECDYASASEWQYCLGVEETNCKSDNSSLCDSRCKWARCTYKNRRNGTVERTISDCVPYTARKDKHSCEELIETEGKDEERDRHDEQTLFDFKYCGHEQNFEILHPKKHSAEAIILFALVILLVLFILSICYYRWKITNHKQAPFTPPSCCPDWVYPRIQTDDYQTAPAEN